MGGDVSAPVARPLCAVLAVGCGASRSGDDPGRSPSPPAIESFTSAVAAVHVGESTQLVAVFSGDTATIDGIGASISVDANYLDRFRQLAPSPVAYTQHVAMALADGGALVMGGNSSESPNVPDTDSSHRFDACRIRVAENGDGKTNLLEAA